MSHTFEEEGYDSYFDEVALLVLETRKASASLIQRRLKLGYARAARVLDQLEKAGIVGEADGAKPRKILIDMDEYKNAREEFLKYGVRPEKNGLVSEMIPKVKWKKISSSQIKNKTLADYVSKAKDFEILLGKDDKDELVTLDMRQAGNVIISGSQFTNVKQLVNQIIVSASLKWSDDDLKMILVDGMQDELVFPTLTGHLLTPMIRDPEKVISSLKWAVTEIENRIKIVRENQKVKFPNILIVIHGFDEVYYFSPNETEDNLVRLQRFGRKVGVYLILTMDHVSFSEHKNIIASNPARIAFKPVDDRFKERNLAEVAELKGPNEAVLWSMYQENKKFEVLKINPKKIYKQIFRK
jgi:DNA segregation ATPase FtsK/SpoIIIE-like protein